MSELLWNDVNAKLPDEGVQVLCTGFCRDVDDNEHAVVTEKRWHAVAHRDQFNNWKPETHGATDGVDNLYAPTHWMQIAPLQQETDKDGERKLPDIEIAAAWVHAAWMLQKQAQGIYSRKAEDGEELMVDYALLSEKQKNADRVTVATVYGAIVALPQKDGMK